MPVTKKTKRAMNLRGYQERRAAERAARLDSSSNHQSPTSPTSPTPPKLPTPPMRSQPLPNSESDTVSDATVEPDVPLFSKRAPPPPELVKEAIPALEEIPRT